MLVKNRKATHEYEIKDRLTAGVVLSGAEVKSLRLKHASLTGSFVKVIQNEIFLINAQINPYFYAAQPDYDPKRTRKLLLKKKEVRELQEKLDQKGWAAVPLHFFLAGKRVKLEIGVGRGKKEFEKRAVLKDRAQKREMERELKKW